MTNIPDPYSKGETPKTVSVSEAAEILGNGVTKENVRARIRRGSLEATKDNGGKWRISTHVLQTVLNEVEPCNNCNQNATSYVIIKYPHHDRVEFALCEVCAEEAEKAYSRQGRVLEVIGYPILGEGWLKPR